MARAWQAFDGPMLLLLSGDDYTAKEFVEHARMAPAWSGALGRNRLERWDVPGADHTFSDAASRNVVEQATVRWLGGFASATREAPGVRHGTVFMEQEHG
jgi:hypothetical protein